MAKPKRKHEEPMDHYDGFSPNQVRLVLGELKLSYDEFNEWMRGQTGPLLIRRDRRNRPITVPGVYPYDLFRWIRNKTKGTPLIWD